MIKVNIVYNPFLLTTRFLINGKKPSKYSSLDFPKQRLQEWAEKLPEILVDEYRDRNVSVEFTGTLDDFSDFKEIMSAKSDVISVSEYIHHRKQDVSAVEEEVVKIYKEILDGPVEALKDSNIKKNFENAIASEFTINVVATVSSGKSTLINSLLGKKLMPIGQRATTATIARIIATDQPYYSGLAYDSNHNELYRVKELDYKTMREWNKDPSISMVDIEGPIACVDKVGMRLVLMDTPGPNNSRDENHKAITYGMMESSEKSLVLFVIAGALEINDEKVLLDFIFSCMKKGGKQSRDRFIFAINKLNCFNPEDDSVEDALSAVNKNLDERDIKNPNLFPVAALTAMEIRTKAAEPETLDKFKSRCSCGSEFHFEKYYQYNHLPLNSRGILQNKEKESEADALLVHTGIPSIEEAIRLYVNKYARTIKVKDLVDSFNTRLRELKAVAEVQKRISESKEEKKKLDAAIIKIENEIQSGRSAQTYAELINSIDISQKVEEEVEELLGTAQNRIDKIISQYTNSTKIPEAQAMHNVTELESYYQDIQYQLGTHIDKLFDKSVKRTYDKILNIYLQRLSKLGLSSEKESFEFNPIDFIGGEIIDLRKLISDSTNEEDEGKYEPKDVKAKRPVERSKWNPARWFGSKYRIETYTRTIEVWKPDPHKYVDMSKVVSEYFVSLQVDLIDLEKKVPQHINKEILHLKETLKVQLGKVEDLLVKKLNEVKSMSSKSSQTAEEIEKQESNLKWMNGMINRVNSLINY